MPAVAPPRAGLSAFPGTELSRVPARAGTGYRSAAPAAAPPRPVPLPAGHSPGLPAAGLPRASPSALRSSSKFSLLLIFQVPAKLGMAGRALQTAAGTRRCCSLSGSGTL